MSSATGDAIRDRATLLVMVAVDPDVGTSRFAYSRGTVLADRFILRRRLAEGGSGEVWVASNRATGGAVAIKLVKASASALNAARFRQEAALSAALAHRNVVQVFDFFDTRDGILGLVMECLRGETARERLERAGPLSPRAAVALVTQALAGLAHAHERRIVHRDIKPPNLFLATDPDGSTTTKILDFGIAHTPSNTVHTLHGQLLGTPRYMSPEQIRADGAIDGRSDIFSTATVLYELVTGRCPFAAPFSTASLAAVLETKVERDERIPPALWEAIARALSKDRNLRPATAREFADALRAAVESDDGVLARELHRSRPPPPLFFEETNGPIVLVPGTDAPPPLSRSTRATRVRDRASRIVLGVTAVSFAILAAAAVRIAVSSRSGAPVPGSAAPVSTAPFVPPPAVLVASPPPAVLVASPPPAEVLAPPEPAHPPLPVVSASSSAPAPPRPSDAARPSPVVARPPARAPARHPSTKPAGTLVRDPGF